MSKQLAHPYSSYKKGPLRPCLTIEMTNKFSVLSGKSKSLKFRCILDTGADWNLLPVFVCDVLGHDLKAGSGPFKFVGVGNQTMDAYLHSNKIKIYGADDSIFYDGEMKFYIAEGWHSDIGLLGHDEFFRKFPVFFDTARNYFIVYSD